MTEEAGFLAAIKADPLDQAPRLVYADWLDDHGDPRGEFLRVRHQLDNVAPHSPEFADLRLRLTTLAHEIDPEWQGIMYKGRPYRPLFYQLPADRQHRWRLVEEFVDTWYRPLGPQAAYSEAEIVAAEQELGFRLPAAMREWYGQPGSRGTVWSGQDSLVPPNQLGVMRRRGMIVVRTENQYCALWGFAEAAAVVADPAIFDLATGDQANPTTRASPASPCYSKRAFLGWERVPTENSAIRKCRVFDSRA